MASIEIPSDDPVYRMRWWLAASSCIVFVLAIAFGIGHRQQWNWSLLLWGLAVGALQFGFLELNVALIKHYVQVPAFRREGHARRRPIYVLMMLELGVIVGVAAAGFDRVGFVIAGLLLVLLNQAISLLVLVRLVRRSRAAQ